jgi:dipeptidyl aminopeptidase/acylaminoacyl peptidase
MTNDTHVFDPSRPEGESANIRAIVNLFGPTDLTADPATAEPWQIETVENMLGVPLAEASPLLQTASPITYARTDGPPILTIHGDADTVVPVSQGRSLDAALRAAGQSHQYVEIPGMGHIDGGLWSLPFAQIYRATIFAFLAANL